MYFALGIKLKTTQPVKYYCALFRITIRLNQNYIKIHNYIMTLTMFINNMKLAISKYNILPLNYNIMSVYL